LERYRTIQGYTKEVETKTLAQRVFKINTRYTTDGKENTEKTFAKMSKNNSKNYKWRNILNLKDRKMK
jgi:hypothetical protein